MTFRVQPDASWQLDRSTYQFPEPMMQTFFGAAISEEMRREVAEVKEKLHWLQSCYETTLFLPACSEGGLTPARPIETRAEPGASFREQRLAD